MGRESVSLNMLLKLYEAARTNRGVRLDKYEVQSHMFDNAVQQRLATHLPDCGEGDFMPIDPCAKSAMTGKRLRKTIEEAAQ